MVADGLSERLRPPWTEEVQQIAGSNCCQPRFNPVFPRRGDKLPPTNQLDAVSCESAPLRSLAVTSTTGMTVP